MKLEVKFFVDGVEVEHPPVEELTQELARMGDIPLETLTLEEQVEHWATSFQLMLALSNQRAAAAWNERERYLRLRSFIQKTAEACQSNETLPNVDRPTLVVI